MHEFRNQPGIGQH